MLKTIQQLREKRNEMAKSLRSLVEDHDGEWLSENQEKYDELTNSISEIDEKIERMQNALDLTAVDSAEIDRVAQQAGITEEEAGDNATIHNEIMDRWVRGGDRALSATDYDFLNALSTGTDSEGGFTVPQNFQARLLDVMREFGGMREVSTVISVADGRDMEWPTTDSSSEEGEIVAENTDVDEDNDISFGLKKLIFYVYSSKATPVPRQLLQDTGIDLEGHIVGRHAMRIARLQNKLFTIGTGTNQPLGVVGAAGVGVTATGTDTIDFDDLVDLKHSVDPAYRLGSRYMFHDTTLAHLKKKKDTQGRPLWLPSVGDETPATIDNTPYTINQHMAVLGTGNKPVAYGDFSKFLIADATSAELFRFTDSAYTKRNQVGFLTLLRTGAAFVDVGGAVKTLQNA